MQKFDPITTERFEKYLNDTDYLQNDQKKMGFYNHLEFQPYFLISYAEFLKIWGFDYNLETNPERLNKWLIYAQVDWYNNIYNETWAWKWYPLFLKCAYNTVRLRQTSIIFSFLYIGCVDRLFDRYMVYKNLDKKKIKINTLLNYNLSKQKLKTQDKEIFTFKGTVRTIIEDFGDLNYVVAGHPLDIYNPNFEWDQEVNKTYEEVRKQFFLQNNQMALLTQRINLISSWLYKNISNPKGRNKMQIDIKSFFDGYVYNLPQRFLQEIEKFQEYRRNFDSVPDKRKINTLLEYDKINKQKLYYEQDDLKLCLSKVFNTFNYYSTGVAQFQLYKVKIFNRNLFEIQPQFKTESFLYDFVTFTVLCLIPLKLMFGKKSLRQNLRQMQQQAKYFSTRND